MFPTYAGRSGSKCFFTFNKKFVDQNKTKAVELVSLYTLYMFGSNSTETEHKVLILGASGFHEYSLEICMTMLINNNLKHRVFHKPSSYEKKIFYLYTNKVKCLVSEQVVPNIEFFPKINGPKYDDYSPCTYDTYGVKIYTGEHLLKSANEDPNVHVTKRISEYEESIEPHSGCFKCKICDASQDEPDTNAINSGDKTKKEEIIVNNLIFDFKKYQFIIKNTNNIFNVTFDSKAVGGYRHASIFTGAIFEVVHALPDTMKYLKTTYVNTIKIIMNDANDEYYFVAEYKAIDNL